MQVITVLKAESGDADFYHILDDYETGSLCGAVDVDEVGSNQTADIVSRAEAETRGLQPCENCLTYTGGQ